MSSTGAPRTGAELCARAIAAHGVRRVFLYPGGTIAPTLNALIDLGVEYVVSRHEQGAGYAALAASRLTRTPQVVMVTSGPGVTNVLTPIADAWYDSTPLVVITGQVGTADLTGRPGVRQRGFQETATLELMAPVTKACLRPMSADEVAEALDTAFRVAAESRPGPVVVDLPMDVQRGAATTHAQPVGVTVVQPDRQRPGSADLEQLAELLEESERPVLLAGQGVMVSGAEAALLALAERFEAPVCTSLLGVGAFPSAHPLSIGYIGHTGAGWANRAVHEADLLVALGARLDVRQTGTRTECFVPGGRVARVDVDGRELAEGRVDSDLNVHADAAETLTALLEREGPEVPAGRKRWLESIRGWREEMPLDAYPAGEGCHPAELLRNVDRLTYDRRLIAVTGVGHHQQWTARHMTFDAPRRTLLTSGGHGAMGYDLPSCVGAAFARPRDLVLCVVGDGSFQINMQEMGTIAEYSLPIKILVLDNRRLAMVSQFQQIVFGDDPSTGGRAAFDFGGFAELYGIRSHRLERWSDGAEAVLRGFLDEPGPALLHASIDPACDVVPMLLAGQSMDRMWPRFEA